ncbi:SAM-dependent methyltransferase [Phytohabitans sp. ZYX-F-186]|uniref:SAM-dependent methyltransferase n=1 Tax=Phytohabitans maris TaxID=3071409 RepID=A0ABU0ZM71_9ACTN|nr:SAM-dependent methyltransferase [Phytohabitans sp. ZYX-F-186]MDQ7908130.1 SAM-dependent methyltransferase [Phytohabitans sp. ZYX-F-186]
MARGRVKIDSSVAHSARVWDYWLGGRDNYASDREAGEQIRQVLPDVVEAARVDRAFLIRAVRHLVDEAGIRQFLDIGTGLPTANNTHEVAQAAAPESRIVYVDNDPIVLAHARALLVGSPLGATDYIDADAHDPETILRVAAETLDFSRPVGIMMLGVVQFIMDDDAAQAIVKRLVDAAPSGSHLAVAHPISGVSAPLEEAVRLWNQTGSAPQALRTPAQIAAFFDGLELLEPGVVPCPQWRPDPAATDLDVAPWRVCAVGRKP